MVHPAKQEKMNETHSYKIEYFHLYRILIIVILINNDSNTPACMLDLFVSMRG